MDGVSVEQVKSVTFQRYLKKLIFLLLFFC